MNALQEIIAAFEKATKAGQKTALATVVQLNGSSYRRPGARMLINDIGEMTGAISGGCLEGDALRKALLAIGQQQSKLVVYDTSDEDDVALGVQLGCAGIIHVLFEPINPENHYSAIQLIKKAITIRQPAVLVTLFFPENKRAEQPGTCFLLEHNREISGNIPYNFLEDSIITEAKDALTKKQSTFKQFITENISVTAFIECIEPPIHLVVIGAGNDAVPMVKIATCLGWEVSVVDGRNTHATPERFTASCQILVSKPEKVLDQIHIDDQTVFVMMTHNYNYDLAMLKALLPKMPNYIGMLGPKLKLDRMLEELRNEGMDITDEMLQKVYGPTGLEIGAETPEEIALSIIAEIKAVLAGKSGGFLKLKNDVIHSREAIKTTEKRVD